MADPTSVERCLYLFNAPCLTSSEWAAWVQAVGSVIALALAVGIPYAQHKASAAATRLREVEVAKSRALVALPIAREYWREVDQVVFEKDITRPDYEFIKERLTPPQGLLVFAAQSHELGEAARPFQELVFMADQVDALIDQVIFLESIDSSVEDVEKAEELVWQAVDRLSARAGQLVTAFRGVFEGAH